MVDNGSRGSCEFRRFLARLSENSKTDLFLGATPSRLGEGDLDSRLPDRRERSSPRPELSPRDTGRPPKRRSLMETNQI